MKKITVIILAVLILALALTGCVREDINIRLNRDGSGSVSVTYAVNNEFLEKSAALNDGSDFFEGRETFETEYDGERYTAFTEVKECASLEELEKLLSELTFGSDASEESQEINTAKPSEITLSVKPSDNESDPCNEPMLPSTATDDHIFKSVKITHDGNTYIFDAVLNENAIDIPGYDLSEVFKLSVSLDMPGKIKAYKNGTCNGRHIDFDVGDLKKETRLYAECSVTSPIPAIIGIGLAGIGFAAFILLKKKR
ncbi:MAG: hypothetical protein SO122_04760 [Eubacteriales bacterium]|nr:hypothetical protein [Eubacteriales bacterium]